MNRGEFRELITDVCEMLGISRVSDQVIEALVEKDITIVRREDKSHYTAIALLDDILVAKPKPRDEPTEVDFSELIEGQPMSHVVKLTTAEMADLRNALAIALDISTDTCQPFAFSTSIGGLERLRSVAIGLDENGNGHIELY
jgi:hypothetical protein